MTPVGSPPADPAPRPNSRGVYTAAEMAALLGCSVRHVWRMRDAGRLPAPVRVGRLVRWSKQVVDNWLRADNPAAAR